MNTRWPGRAFPAAVFLVLALASAAPVAFHPGSIAFWPRALFNDLLLSHLPNALVAHDALFEWHQAPLWNPVLLSGMPFAADPLAGIAYPPNWLAVLFPTAQAFNLLFLLHLAWAGLGAYRLSRAEGVGPLAAYAAGIVFAAGTKFATHVSLGHIGLVSAASWTPWVLLAWRRVLTGNNEEWVRRAILAGGALGVTFLADPRWLLPTALLTFAYVLYQIQGPAERAPLKALLQRGVLALLFTLGLSACLLLPLIEFTRLSTRAAIAPAELDIFSLSTSDLLGSIVLRSGEPEQFVYFGVAGLLLGILALLQSKRVIRFWAGAALVAGLLALGASTPVYGWFRDLIPGADLLRVPARFLFLAILALGMLAAEGLEALALRRLPAEASRRERLAGFVFCAIVLVFNGTLLLTRGLPAPAAMAPFLAAAAGLGLFFAGGKLFRSTLAFTSAWLLLAAAELIWVDAALLVPRPLAEFQHAPEVMDLVPAVPGSSRVFSPTFNVSTLQAATFGLQQVEGISPLQLESYRTYLARALGFPGDQYSVTLPPYEEQAPASDLLAGADLTRLEMLNIGWIVTSAPLHVPGLHAEPVGAHGFHYRVPGARPRAWLETGDSGGESEWRGEDPDLWSPNRIVLSVDGPGMLVLSEISYPGWVVQVDGQKAEMQLVEGLFRGVMIPQGTHQVEFAFQPLTVYAGWALSLITAAALVLLLRRR